MVYNEAVITILFHMMQMEFCKWNNPWAQSISDISAEWMHNNP